MPVTASVTVCSTCRRGLASMKKKWSAVSNRNSKVVRPRSRAEAAIAQAARVSGSRSAAGSQGLGAISISF